MLAGRDLQALERFYVGAVGFSVTERLSARVGPLDVRGTFLHCNRRHHTLALLSVPQRRRLNHFMLQAESLVDVIRAHDRARRRGVAFSLELGQHPPPDWTVSFYARTPSGFDFEIGAGDGEIEPHGWKELLQTTTSSWGARADAWAQAARRERPACLEAQLLAAAPRVAIAGDLISCGARLSTTV